MSEIPTEAPGAPETRSGTAAGGRDEAKEAALAAQAEAPQPEDTTGTPAGEQTGDTPTPSEENPQNPNDGSSNDAPNPGVDSPNTTETGDQGNGPLPPTQ